MKITEIILEDEPGVKDIYASAKEIAAHLSRDCSQYLSQIKPYSGLWRGVKRGILPEFADYSCPIDRRPLDTARSVHEVTDEWFMMTTGIKYRSNAVFATGSKETASIYGTPYAMFPIGEFKFCWSRDVGDMTQDISDIVTGRTSMEYPGVATDERSKVFELLDRSEYQTNDLARAISSQNEIMIHCGKYYLIGGKNPRRDMLIRYVMEEL